MRRQNSNGSSPSPSTRQLLLTLGAAALAAAKPYPRDNLHDWGFSYLMPRDCASYCGAQNQICCEANQVCTTLPGDVATCVGGGGGYFGGAYTTTWTQTYTSTIYTNWIPAPAPTAGVDCKPQAPEQEACGTVCCAGWQTCAFKGQCSSKPGYAEPSTVVVTSDGIVTTRYSAPYRVTGVLTLTNSGVSTVTATGTSRPTVTGDSEPIGADGSNKGGTGGGLSGGAIAGIVIGTLAGVALLMLLCFCCIARGVWNTIFGKKKKHEEKIIIEEERYSRHGSRVPSAYSRRDRHHGWFGGGGRPSSAGNRRPKKSGDGWWLGIAGAAAALLALLTFKKDKHPARKTVSSRYSDSYYTYSDVTGRTRSSPSSSSSGGRTHRTGRTGRSYRSGYPRDASRGGGSYYSRATSRRP